MNNHKNPDPLVIAGRTFSSRLFIGTGKFPSARSLRETIEASGSEVVTVALRRVDLSKEDNDGILSAIDSEKQLILPNTSGARTAEEAVRLARLARAAGLEPWVKLELTPEPRYLLPDPLETLKAAEILVKDGFVVLPYIQADPMLAKRLEEAGTATVMPLGAPIGSNRGIRTRDMIRIIIEQASVPVVVDAGLGAPSHAAEAMEMGADAVLVNTALADAADHGSMGRAFGLAVEAGRLACRAGMAPEREQAAASSPLTGFLLKAGMVGSVPHERAALLEEWPRQRIDELHAGITEADVRRALGTEQRSIRDLAALLSPTAQPWLESMAQEAQRLTRWHFGRTMGLYAPIYISNLCASDCVYCCFAARSGLRDRRTTLKPRDFRKECEALAARGFDNVLLLTGEAPRIVGVDYIAECVSIAREYFSTVGVEVYALDEAGYRTLADKGLEGMTLYMETYDRETYSRVHLLGEKMNYDFRLDASERAGRAGVRRLTLGALLGLHNWRHDVIWLALHARYLQKVCWQSAVALSFPRLLHTPERYHVEDLVSDLDLVQIILALRLFLPEAGFNLSTRESALFRDRLAPLGITAVSAGSSTRPGGYATRGEETLEQFEIEDTRSPEEVVAMLKGLGYDPVWKDFDRAFDAL